MRSHVDMAHLPVISSLPQVGALPISEMLRWRQGRLTHTDQINLSQRIRDVQQAGQVLAHTLEVRETKIVALRRNVESGHYSVEAEQVAEKLVKDYLLDLCSY